MTSRPTSLDPHGVDPHGVDPHGVDPQAAVSSASRPSRWWLLLLGVAAIEVVGHFVVQSRVVPASDWDAAAAHVRAQWAEGDAVTVAPRWADPLMREAMGDRVDVATVGRSDLAAYRRLWSLSIRGHRASDAPPDAPDAAWQFGRVRLERWDLPQDETVLYDFVDHVEDAQVAILEPDGARECRWTRSGRPSGGGLGSGPITPGERHVCDPRRPWLWVGATVEEDLEMLPRRCIWQHPPGAEPVRASWTDVPLGESIVLYGGLWWEHERTMDGGPVDVVVRVDGQEVGRLTHTDGDGWKRIEAAVPELLRGGRGRVDVEVSAPSPHLRTLCWAATTRTRAEAGEAAR
ncbi:MAG: hypothetical protein M3Y87_15650 [Myxococcota bacterium]|nr:hypothetical protein [Myxococcota bacterium]